MKTKKNKFIALAVFFMLPLMLLGQYNAKYRLTNFKQVNETSYVFDLELHNVGTETFALASAQVKIDLNIAMFNGQIVYNGPNQVASCISTDLTGEYGAISAGSGGALASQMEANYNSSGYIVYFTNALPTGGPLVDLFLPGTFKKLATIKVLFKTGTTPANAKFNPFAEVSHNTAFNPVVGQHTVTIVDSYDTTTSPLVYSTADTETPILVSSVENSLTNCNLAKYCFTGSGNFDNAIRWNNSTSSTVAGFNVVPSSSSNAVIVGACSVNSNTTINNLAVNPGAQLTLNSGCALATMNLFLNCDGANGTGTFVDMNPTSGITVGGTTKVEQYLSTGRNWYISSPVVEALSNVVKTTSANKLWNYTEVNTGSVVWNEIINTSQQLTPTMGYVASVSSNGNIVFSGTLNSGIQTSPLLTREGTISSGFNLVGNPYPSYLDWTAVVDASNTGTTNLEPTMWYRTQKTNATYVFDTFIANGLGSGIGTSNFTNGITSVSKYIPPMQAFWVRIKSGKTSGTLSVDNSMRSHQNQSISTNRLKAPTITNTTQQLLRLLVSNGINSDEAIVYFNCNASNEFDSFDAEKMSNNSAEIPEIYTIAGNEKLVINGLNNVTEAKELPLGFTTIEPNTFSIKATEISNFDTNLKIILRDRLLDIESELKVGNEYHFSSNAINTSSRFSIMFKSISGTTSLEKNDSNESENVHIFKQANNKIAVYSKDKINKTITVYNAIGQRLANQSTFDHLTILDNDFISGVYVVTVTCAGKSIAKRIVLN